LREQIGAAGVTVHGTPAPPASPTPHRRHEAGLHLQADKIIICVGGAA
jgi:hypothetical protein